MINYEIFLPEVKPFTAPKEKTRTLGGSEPATLYYYQTEWHGALTNCATGSRSFSGGRFIVNLNPCDAIFFLAWFTDDTGHQVCGLSWPILYSCINGQESNLILFAEGGHWWLSFGAVQFMGRHTGINFEWFFSVFYVKLVSEKGYNVAEVICTFFTMEYAPFFNQGTYRRWYDIPSYDDFWGKWVRLVFLNYRPDPMFYAN